MTVFIASALLLAAALVFTFRRFRTRTSAKTRPAASLRCPRCGGRLVFRERTFRGAAKEYFYECRNAECGYRRSA